MSAVAIGAALAEARAEAGLTLDQLADRTKVRASLLRSIESGNLEPCGGTVYAKGHIRNIAAALKIDPAPLVAQLPVAADVPTASTALLVSTPAGKPDAALRRRVGARPPWAALGVGAVSLLAVVAVIGFLGVEDNRAPAPASSPVALSPQLPSPSPSPDVAIGPVAPVKATTPSSPAAAAAASGTGVNVTVQVTGDASWVGQYRPGTKAFTFTGTLPAGTRKVFKADGPVTLRIGKPEAVVVYVNGQSVGSPGTAGHPTDVTYGPSGQTTVGAG